MTKKEAYELLMGVMDLVIGGTIAFVVYIMIFDGLFNWVTIGVIAILLGAKVFLEDQIQDISASEHEES